MPVHVTGSVLASAERLAAELNDSGSSTFGLPDQPVPAGTALLIGLFDVSERSLQIRWQTTHAQTSKILRIEIEPDSVCIGPVVAAGAPACTECFLNWTRSEWSERNRIKPNLQGTRSGQPIGNFPAILPVLIDEYITRGAIPGKVAVHNRASSETVARTFIPHPSCSRCKSLVPAVAELQSRDLSNVVPVTPGTFRGSKQINLPELISRFMDQRSGLVRYLFDEPTSEVMPMSVASFLQDGSLDKYENGYGRTTTGQGSQMVALLEALERFAGYMPRARREIVRSSYRELGSDAIDPESFVLHGQGQRDEPGFSLSSYSPDLELSWLYGWSMQRRERVLIPEQLAYYRLPDPPERPTNRFVYEVSSGCAMGGSLIEAALHGLFEVIERDGFLNCWYARRPPVQLDASDAENPNIRSLIARAEAAGYEVHLFDVESEFGVVVVWGLIVNPSADAGVKSYSAAGASIDPEAAIFSALVEVCTSISVYEGKLPQQRDQAAEMLRDSAKVQGMEDHVLLYSHPDSFERLSYLFDRPQREPLKRRFKQWYQDRTPNDLTVIFNRLCDRVIAGGSDVLVVNQTFPDMAAAGLHCVKVLAPGLTPVTFGHQYRRISLERISRYAGSEWGPESLDRVNPYPHNFP